MATGEITVKATDRGAGIVVDDDNAAYNFDPDRDDLSVGDKVTFDIDGDRAINVKLI